MAAPTIDGHSSVAGLVGAGTIALSLTTALANDIIVVGCYNENFGSTAIRTLTSVTATGLTFASRSSNNTTQRGVGISLDVWWALAANPLAALPITLGFSGSTDDAAVVAFGVNGCNTASPWDTNASIPAEGNNGTSANNITLSGISTDVANDLIIAFGGAIANLAAPATPPSGFAFVDGKGTNAGAGDAGAAVYVNPVTAKQSGISVTVGWGAIFCQLLTVDALTAGAPKVPGGAGLFDVGAPYGIGWLRKRRRVR